MSRRTLLTAAAVMPASLVLPAGLTHLRRTYARAAAAAPIVVFAAAHPDDESIGMGVAIAEHAAAGYDVHVLLMTDGEASSVRDALNGTGPINPWWGVAHDPVREGYAPLFALDLAAARVIEAETACVALGGPTGVTVHRASLPDGAVTVAAAQAAILALCDSLTTGPVRLKGHTFWPALESHTDHLAVGLALANLTAYDASRFADRRHYVLPGGWAATGAGLPIRSWDTPTDATIRAQAVNATRAYMAWAPHLGAYAVGYHSKSDWLSLIASSPKCQVHA